jgi:carbohydrate diacid regulator
MLSVELAEKIVIELRKLLNEELIVVNTLGIIIASTDKDRVGKFHEGGLIVCKSQEKLIISKEDQLLLKGVKAGINLPVFSQKEVVGVIGITGDPEVVSPYGEIIQKMTELLISESFYAEQFDWKSRALEAFVFDWLQLKEPDPSFLDRAQLLKIDLSIDRFVIISEFGSSKQPYYRDQWSSIFSWNVKDEQDIIVRWGHNRVIGLFQRCKNRSFLIEKTTRFHHFLQDQLQTNVSIGIGQPVSYNYMDQSYKQAERALKATSGANVILFDEDLLLEMILDEVSLDTKIQFMNRSIGPILLQQDLLDTLIELFKQNYSLKNTAQSLHIHINTLHYRLKKITELTDLSPSIIQDQITLFFALQILDECTKSNKNIF